MKKQAKVPSLIVPEKPLVFFTPLSYNHIHLKFTVKVG